MKFNDYEDVKILKDETLTAVNTILKFKSENFDHEMFNNFQKYVILRTIDEKWQDHLYTMDQLREGIGLRAYGQKNPLIEYKQEGFAMFEDMMEETNKETLKRIFRTDLSKMAQSSMQATQNTKNLKTTTTDNVLNALSQPRPENQGNQSPNLGGIPQRPQAFTPGSKAQPIKVDKKVGRNDKVIIRKGSETKSIKYKKFEKMKEDGWVLEKS